MRKMRDTYLYWLLGVFSVLVLGLGIRHFVKHPPAGQKTDWAAIEKLSNGGAEHGSVEAASAGHDKAGKAEKDAHANAAPVNAAKDKKSHESRFFIDELNRQAKVLQKDEARKKARLGAGAASQGGEGEGFDPGEARGRELASPHGTDDSELCSALEFRGDGPQTRFTDEEWSAVLTEFRRVKKEYLGWLRDNQGNLAPDTAQFMEKQLSSLKIQRPPVHSQPDLGWRGIAAWSSEENGEPIIWVGGGFMKLAKQKPQRARFEIARLIAQTWSPCELTKSGLTGAKDLWRPLLACFSAGGADRGLASDGQSCAAGSYSEAGWAVASALASRISPPDCAVPALQEAAVSECVKKFALGGNSK